jgi:hypothetical protein
MGRDDRKRVHAQMAARRRTRRADLGLGRLDGSKDLAHPIEVISPSAVNARCLVVRLMRRTPRRCSNRVMSFATADGDKPTSSAAPAKLPRSATRWKMAISVAELAIREMPS